MSAPKKRKLQTLETKYRAILEVEAGKKKKIDIAKEIGVPPNTLSTWLTDVVRIKAAFETQEWGPKTKKMKKSQFGNLDKGLDKWFRQARTLDIPISGPIILAEAQNMAKELGYPEVSMGYIAGFKHRKGISFRTIQGEAKSVPQAAVDAWKGTLLPQLLQEFSPSDIYNLDETGLFYKLQPSKSLAYKDEDGRGGKLSKARITVMPCANMDGSHKLKPLVINNCQKPHCFGRKRINPKQLPVDFEANKKAWMTSDIFRRWLQKQNRFFARRQRKIAMVLDNCPAHPNIQDTLTHIKLVYLPPNTTSVTQPLDQGIIRNFKCYYRRYYVQHGLLKAMEKKEEVQWTVLDAIYGIHHAWMKVTPKTISNCFKHCGFEKEDPTPATPATPTTPTTVDDSFEEEDEIPLAQLKKAGITEEAWAAYQVVDDNLLTSAPLTTEDIIGDLTKDEEEEEAEEEEEVTPGTAPPSLAELMDAARMFKDHLCTLDQDCEKAWDSLFFLESFVNKTKTTTQKTMKDFFSLAKPTPLGPMVESAAVMENER